MTLSQQVNTATWHWLITQPEGQFFERKSCYDRAADRPKRREARAAARDVAETLASMANADGGTVAVGLEDDGTPTGVDYPLDRLRVIREALATLVRPPLKARVQEVILDDQKILVFEVDWSPEVHQLMDGRYLLRLGESNFPFPAEQIEALKAGKRRRLAEIHPLPKASIQDLDPTLLAELRGKVRLSLGDEELLLQYRLAESRNGQLVPTLAALLLFGKDPGCWHPRCGVDFVKFEGTERRVGAELNVVKRERLEAPLVRLIEKTFQVVQPHIREQQRLVDLFFEERFEYPTFAWQEAIVNAIAHRDYGLEGVGIEVWMFDDRLEVRSPGELVEPVTLERLRQREHIHASRNPRIVRVLTDLGYMRELGEGIPRMFEVMEREGLRPPEFRLEGGALFTVVLRNARIYNSETLKWLGQFEGMGLNSRQKRLLAYARAHGGTFASRAYQRLVGADIYTASIDIKDLMRKGIARLTKKGGRVYQIVSPGERAVTVHALPADLQQMWETLETRLSSQGFLQNQDVRQILGLSRKQARDLFKRLVTHGLLELEGRGRGARYVPKK